MTIATDTDIPVGTVKLPVVPKHPKALCDGCPLYETGTYVPSTFPSRACSTGNQIAFVGEAPGKDEKRRGQVFVGASGEVLKGKRIGRDRMPGILEHLGIDWTEALLTNASACHYPKGKGEGHFEKLPAAAVEHCRPRLLWELEQAGVDTAVAMGAHALKSVIDTGTGITLARAGGPRPSTYRPDMLVVPTFHPAYALRNHTVFQFIVDDLRKVNDGIWDKWEEVKYRVIVGEAEASQEIAKLWYSTREPIICDTESGDDKDDVFGGAIKDVLCIGIKDAQHDEVLVFPRDVFTDNVRRMLGKLFMRNGLDGQHLKYDICRVLNVFLGVDGLLDIKIKRDRMLESYCLREVSGIHSLGYMGQEYLGTPDWKPWAKISMEEGRAKAKAEAKARKEKLGNRFNGLNYAWIDPRVLHKYNAYDVAVTDRLRPYFEPRIAAVDGLPKLYDHLIDVANMLVHVEQRGMEIDLDYNHALEIELRDSLEKIDFGSGVGKFNPNSPIQVRALMDSMGVHLEDTRRATLDNLVKFYKITGTRDDIVDFCETLIEFRGDSKMLSTYVVGLRNTLVDGIAHPDYGMLSTTGRLKARNPNSQNTPQGSKFRRQYVARSGKVLIQADYKQAELRVMCWLAKDGTLRAIFMSPGDIFWDMCLMVYPGYKAWDGERQENGRKLVKTIAYGTAYNRGPAAIAEAFGISVAEARRIQASFNAKIPDVIRYRDSVMDTAVNCGDLITSFGRRRRFRLVTDQNWHDVRNEAAAHMPQSEANDICLRSAVLLDRAGLPIVNLIHDAIIAEVDKSDVEEAKHLMQEIMVGTAEERTEGFVPWAVDIAVAKSYGDFKK